MESIYEKIRSIRLQKGLTLKELSEKSGFSISFLSQVERGNCSLAITSLQKIAETLHVPITYFFESPKASKYDTCVKDRQQFQIEGSSSIYTRLGGDFPERTMEPLLTILPPGQTRHVSFHHAGEEFYYVLEGTMTICVDKIEYILKKGDTIHFPSTLEHTWFNPSDNEETHVLSVLTPVIFKS
ncbi:XRE family transcriptional regulator [Brevibacillus laterosporus]|uniref:helix-turn-helix domain-containing protein n=1 Tax=Brevibacillus laterosporus TaxID=1465 RepID=UPI002E22549B|nr:XRE family transcriptional regulator [Brevibacillus laterosporus]